MSTAKKKSHHDGGEKSGGGELPPKPPSIKVGGFDAKSFNLWTYLRVEMFGIGEPGTLEPPNQAHIDNFFMVPFNLESLIFLGFFICLDAFLYVITYLPIRVVFSLYLLVTSGYNYICGHYFSPFLPFLFPSAQSNTKANRVMPLRFHRTQGYDIMRGVMFAVGCVVLRQIDMSQVYHFIRGQSMIKLYVLTSMLEIFDKLLSSFGQDAFDALHWYTRFNPYSFKLAITFFMVTCYVSIHATVYFLHVATLTVVINSVDSALFTVLILNNFTELKTFILKKFDCNNLFQLACSDITERFQTFLFLSLILLVAVAQAGGFTRDMLYTYGRIAVLMLVGECFADWFKHAFINKFNLINASVYKDFAYVLRNDILSNQKDEVILDHTYSVTRRLGLSQIPLGCVCVRYIMLALATPYVQLRIEQSTAAQLVTRGAVVFLGLLLLKVAIGVGLVFYSADAHRRDDEVFLRNPSAQVQLGISSASGGGGGAYKGGSGCSTGGVAMDASGHGTSGTVLHNSITPGTSVLQGAPLSRQSSHQGGAGANPDSTRHSAAVIGTPWGIASLNVSPRAEQQHHGHHHPPLPLHAPQAHLHNQVIHSRMSSYSEPIDMPLEEDDVLNSGTNTLTNTGAASAYVGEKTEDEAEWNEEGVGVSFFAPERDGGVRTNIEDRRSAAPTTERESSQPSSPQRSTAAQGSEGKVQRPPLGKLNMNTMGGYDQIQATPPMSPHNTRPFPHVPGPGSELNSVHGVQTPSAAAAGGPGAGLGMVSTTSTPIVQLQLDAAAFSAYAARTAAAQAQAQAQGHSLQHLVQGGSVTGGSEHGEPSHAAALAQQENWEASDTDEARSVCSEMSRHTAVDEVAQKLQERLQFMEELSSMERYTVYKGRIL